MRVADAQMRRVDARDRRTTAHTRVANPVSHVVALRRCRHPTLWIRSHIFIATDTTPDPAAPEKYPIAHSRDTTYCGLTQLGARTQTRIRLQPNAAMSFLSRAAVYAGRTVFGTRAHVAAGCAAAAAAALAAGSTVALADKKERSFIMLKPDAVQRGLVGEIIQRFEKRGYKLVAMKMIHPSKDLAEAHYHDLKERPFFPRLTTYLSSSPVVAMVWEGEDIVRQGRVMIGQTKPLESPPGTIRGDLAIVVENNVIHGSDTVENAQAEIKLWFGKDGVSDWDNCKEGWVY